MTLHNLLAMQKIHLMKIGAKSQPLLSMSSEKSEKKTILEYLGQFSTLF